MATTLSLGVRLSNLRRDVTTYNVEGGIIATLVDVFSEEVAALVTAIPEFRFAERQERVRVTAKVGIVAEGYELSGPDALPADPIGFLDMTIEVDCPDEVGANIQADGTPGARFRDAVSTAVPAAFEAAGGNDFIDAVAAEGGMSTAFTFQSIIRSK